MNLLRSLFFSFSFPRTFFLRFLVSFFPRRPAPFLSPSVPARLWRYFGLNICANFVAKSFFETFASDGWMTSQMNCLRPSSGLFLNLRQRIVKSLMSAKKIQVYWTHYLSQNG